MSHTQSLAYLPVRHPSPCTLTLQLIFLFSDFGVEKFLGGAGGDSFRHVGSERALSWLVREACDSSNPRR